MHSLPASLSGKSAIEVLYAGKIVLIFYLFFYRENHEQENINQQQRNGNNSP